MASEYTLKEESKEESKDRGSLQVVVTNTRTRETVTIDLPRCHASVEGIAGTVSALFGWQVASMKCGSKLLLDVCEKDRDVRHKQWMTRLSKVPEVTKGLPIILM